MKIKKILLCLICMLFIGSVSAYEKCDGTVCFQYPTSVKAGEEFEVIMIIREANNLRYVKATNYRANNVTTGTTAHTMNGFVGLGNNNSVFNRDGYEVKLEVKNDTGRNGTVPVIRLRYKALSSLTTKDKIEINMDNVYISSNANGANAQDASGTASCIRIYVTEDTVVTPKCEEKDGKFYDNNGNVVTEAKYNEVCKTTTPKCEYKNGNYYGKNGNVVTKSVYESECTPKCKIQDGKYYDNNGNVVTKDVYEEACGNPNTGINTTLVIVVAGSLLVIGCYAFFKKNKMYY